MSKLLTEDEYTAIEAHHRDYANDRDEQLHRAQGDRAALLGHIDALFTGPPSVAIESFKRALLARLLKPCPEAARALLDRVYPNGVPTERLDGALNLVQRTIEAAAQDDTAKTNRGPVVLTDAQHNLLTPIHPDE